MFTPDDVARVRIAEHLDPMWEIVLSLHQLGARRSRHDPFRNWAAWIQSMARDAIAPAAAELYEIVLQNGIFPTFHQAEAHRRTATQRLATGGVHALLAGLGAGIRWTPSVLTAPYPADLTVDLAGRGLTLIPSFFCRGAPVTLANVELDPVLVYPLDPPRHWMQPADCGDGADRHLAALVGRPRAALLRVLTIPMGTSHLAARTGMSLSSASEHTAILRNCGLVTSTRNGRHVIHSLTPLGRHVLAGGLPAARTGG